MRGEIWLQPCELAEWNAFTAADAYAALAGGADELFLRQLRAVGTVYKQLDDKSDPLLCLVCKSPIARPPGLVGWVKPVKRDALGAFALCHPCAEDRSEGFHQRFLAAIGGEGSRDIPAGKA